MKLLYGRTLCELKKAFFNDDVIRASDSQLYFIKNEHIIYKLIVKL